MRVGAGLLTPPIWEKAGCRTGGLRAGEKSDMESDSSTGFHF